SPAAGGVHHVVLGAQPREREAGAAPRLLDDGGRLHRLEDLLHRVPDREHVARRVLQRILLPRVHQRGRVGQEVAVDHPVVEGGGHFRDRGLAAPEAGLRGRDGEGHAPAHLLGGLAHLAVLAREVTLAKHTQGRLRPAPHPRWPRLVERDLFSDVLPIHPRPLLHRSPNRTWLDNSCGRRRPSDTCTWGTCQTISHNIPPSKSLRIQRFPRRRPGKYPFCWNSNPHVETATWASCSAPLSALKLPTQI